MSSAVSRRGVIGGVVVTVGAGIAGYAAAHNSKYAKQRRGSTAANNYGYTGSSGRRELTPLSDVPTGGGVVLSKQDVVVTRDDSGTVHAFSATCTHQGCQVTDVKNGQIICPCHGSRFDARTGEPTAGPASRPLPVVAVTVEGDTVYAG